MIPYRGHTIFLRMETKIETKMEIYLKKYISILVFQLIGSNFIRRDKIFTR